MSKEEYMDWTWNGNFESLGKVVDRYMDMFKSINETGTVCISSHGIAITALLTYLDYKGNNSNTDIHQQSYVYDYSQVHFQVNNCAIVVIDMDSDYNLTLVSTSGVTVENGAY